MLCTQRLRFPSAGWIVTTLDKISRLCYNIAMTNPEQSHQLPATPQQAAELLTEVGTLTTLQGTNYGDRNTFGTPLEEVPTAIAEHLPTPDATSDVSHSAYIVQIFDRATGQPKREGVVGMVTVTRHEKPVPGVIYAAHANYHITTSDGGETYGLERHATNTERGLHMVRSLGRTSLDPAQMLAELTALKDKVERERPIEQAMGLFTVTQTEAQQVIDLTAGLNK